MGLSEGEANVGEKDLFAFDRVVAALIEIPGIVRSDEYKAPATVPTQWQEL
jgi:hypothetical protein